MAAHGDEQQPIVGSPDASGAAALQHARAAPMERLAAAIERNERLDAPAYAVANAASTALQVTGSASRPLQNTLHGRWLGHPLHPILATLPVGAWTLAVGIDALDACGTARGRALRPAADAALAAGAAGAGAAAVAGLADWRQIHGRDRRTGFVHGALNSAGLALMLGALQTRRQGRRGAGRRLAAAGWLATMAGAWLGGHLVYRRRIGVDHGDRGPEPRRWEPVIRLDELEDSRPRRVAVWDPAARAETGVVLVRQGGEVHALGARCSHLGGPLDEGWVSDGGLVCPWHGSRFCLASGRVLDGPSTAPQSLYAARVRAGMVEIRHVPESGDEAVMPEDIEEAVADQNARAPTPEAPGADTVLFEHHELMRGLFRAVESMDRNNPERRDAMLLLARELEIHERVEDALFYPAVRPVSEDVPAAHAEHQQLADMLAETLRLGPSTPAFERRLRELHAAMDHHARSEEESMFREADRLGDARLRELGAAIDAMLEQERTSAASRAFRALKFRALEGMRPS